MANTVLDPAILSKSTGATIVRAAQWLAPLSDAMLRFGIDTPLRQAAFLAQLGHESAGLSQLEENLNYSADALRRVFGKYFPTAELAAKYARKPQAIANRTYASRMGNGDEASGDGWRFRGRGPIQLTFKDNYKAVGAGIGVDLVSNPDKLLEPKEGSLAAALFWKNSNANKYADIKDIDGVSDVVNKGRKTGAYGDANGFEHRAALYKAALSALGA